MVVRVLFVAWSLNCGGCRHDRYVVLSGNTLSIEFEVEKRQEGFLSSPL